jgi:cysteine desulfurase
VANVAALIGCDADEIVFTSGATEANNLALLGVGRRAAGGMRRRILIGATEHKCVLTLGRILRDQLGYELTHIPVDRTGRIDLPFLENELDDDVLLVSVMAVNNEIGTIQDIPAISKLTERCGSILHCDGAQAPCALDLSNFSRYVDMLSLSGHKMYGPMGIGVLYIRRDLQQKIEPIIYGGGQQNGLRSGTVPTVLCVGLGAAAGLMLSDKGGIERIALAKRRDSFFKALREAPCKVWLNGPTELDGRHPGNLNIGFEGIDANDLLSKVQPILAASTGSACTSGIPEPSHVLRAIGLSEQDANSSVRFSLGRNTTDDDVKEASEIILSAVGELVRRDLLLNIA